MVDKGVEKNQNKRFCDKGRMDGSWMRARFGGLKNLKQRGCTTASLASGWSWKEAYANHYLKTDAKYVSCANKVTSESAGVRGDF